MDKNILQVSLLDLIYNLFTLEMKIVLISRLHSTLAYQYLLVGHDLSDALLFFLAPTHPQVTVSAPYHQ